jgi:hypothetical protein
MVKQAVRRDPDADVDPLLDRSGRAPQSVSAPFEIGADIRIREHLQEGVAGGGGDREVVSGL